MVSNYFLQAGLWWQRVTEIRANLEHDQIVPNLTGKWIIISQTGVEWKVLLAAREYMRICWELLSMYLLATIAARLWSLKLMIEEYMKSNRFPLVKHISSHLLICHLYS